MDCRIAMDHLRLIRTRDANDKAWSARAAAFPHLDKDGQKEAWAEITALVPRQRTNDIGTVLTGDARICYIGEQIIHKRPVPDDLMSWLRTQDVTAEQAVARFHAWREEELANPFWD